MCSMSVKCPGQGPASVGFFDNRTSQGHEGPGGGSGGGFGKKLSAGHSVDGVFAPHAPSLTAHTAIADHGIVAAAIGYALPTGVSCSDSACLPGRARDWCGRFARAHASKSNAGRLPGNFSCTARWESRGRVWFPELASPADRAPDRECSATRRRWFPTPR